MFKSKTQEELRAKVLDSKKTPIRRLKALRELHDLDGFPKDAFVKFVDEECVAILHATESSVEKLNLELQQRSFRGKQLSEHTRWQLFDLFLFSLKSLLGFINDERAKDWEVEKICAVLKVFLNSEQPLTLREFVLTIFMDWYPRLDAESQVLRNLDHSHQSCLKRISAHVIVIGLRGSADHTQFDSESSSLLLTVFFSHIAAKVDNGSFDLSRFACHWQLFRSQILLPTFLNDSNYAVNSTFDEKTVSLIASLFSQSDIVHRAIRQWFVQNSIFWDEVQHLFNSSFLELQRTSTIPLSERSLFRPSTNFTGDTSRSRKVHAVQDKTLDLFPLINLILSVYHSWLKDGPIVRSVDGHDEPKCIVILDEQHPTSLIVPTRPFAAQLLRKVMHSVALLFGLSGYIAATKEQAVIIDMVQNALSVYQRLAVSQLNGMALELRTFFIKLLLSSQKASFGSALITLKRLLSRPVFSTLLYSFLRLCLRFSVEDELWQQLQASLAGFVEWPELIEEWEKIVKVLTAGISTHLRNGKPLLEPSVTSRRTSVTAFEQFKQNSNKASSSSIELPSSPKTTPSPDTTIDRDFSKSSLGSPHNSSRNSITDITDTFLNIVPLVDRNRRVADKDGSVISSWLSRLIKVWNNMLCVLGDVSKINVPICHAMVIQSLSRVYRALHRTFIIADENYRGGWTPQFIQSFFNSVQLHSRFESGKVQSFRTICEIFLCSSFQKALFNPHYLQQFYLTLACALRANRLDISQLAISYATKLFSVDLPGASILIVDLLSAANRVSKQNRPISVDSADMTSPNAPATLMLASMCCLIHTYGCSMALPSMKEFDTLNLFHFEGKLAVSDVMRLLGPNLQAFASSHESVLDPARLHPEPAAAQHTLAQPSVPSTVSSSSSPVRERAGSHGSVTLPIPKDLAGFDSRLSLSQGNLAEQNRVLSGLPASEPSSPSPLARRHSLVNPSFDEIPQLSVTETDTEGPLPSDADMSLRLVDIHIQLGYSLKEIVVLNGCVETRCLALNALFIRSVGDLAHADNAHAREEVKKSIIVFLACLDAVDSPVSEAATVCIKAFSELYSQLLLLDENAISVILVCTCRSICKCLPIPDSPRDSCEALIPSLLHCLRDWLLAIPHSDIQKFENVLDVCYSTIECSCCGFRNDFAQQLAVSQLSSDQFDFDDTFLEIDKLSRKLSRAGSMTSLNRIHTESPSESNASRRTGLGSGRKHKKSKRRAAPEARTSSPTMSSPTGSHFSFAATTSSFDRREICETGTYVWLQIMQYFNKSAIDFNFQQLQTADAEWGLQLSDIEQNPQVRFFAYGHALLTLEEKNNECHVTVRAPIGIAKWTAKSVKDGEDGAAVLRAHRSRLRLNLSTQTPCTTQTAFDDSDVCLTDDPVKTLPEFALQGDQCPTGLELDRALNYLQGSSTLPESNDVILQQDSTCRDAEIIANRYNGSITDLHKPLAHLGETETFSFIESDTRTTSFYNNSRHFMFGMGWLSWGSDDKLRPLKKSEKLLRDLKNIDCNGAVRDRHKIAVIYLPPNGCDKNSIIGHSSESCQFSSFVRCLGDTVKLEMHTGYTGKLDAEQFPDCSIIYYANSSLEACFHVSTWLVPNGVNMNCLDEESQRQQLIHKRWQHLGNDNVHIIWCDSVREFRLDMLPTQFGEVTIVIYPLTNGLFRVQILKKDDAAAKMAPLFDGAVVDSKSLPLLVRLTALNADRELRERLTSEPVYKARSSYIKKTISTHQYAEEFETLFGSLVHDPRAPMSCSQTIDGSTLSASDAVSRMKSQLEHAYRMGSRSEALTMFRGRSDNVENTKSTKMHKTTSEA